MQLKFSAKAHVPEPLLAAEAWPDLAIHLSSQAPAEHPRKYSPSIYPLIKSHSQHYY